MAFFIGIACPWLLIAVLDWIAEGRRSANSPPSASCRRPRRRSPATLVPDRPY